MANEKSTHRITKRFVDSAKPGSKSYRLWDCDLRGFGLKVTPTGTKTYIATYRAGTGRGAPQREYTIGRHGTLTPDQARDEAQRILSAARLGADPQADRKKLRGEKTLSQLCDLYLKLGIEAKKASTVRTDRYRIEAHIKPLLGHKRLSNITTGDVERFMRDVASGKSAKQTGSQPQSAKLGGKGTASRTVGLLGGIFSFAVRHNLRADNPVRGVSRFKDRRSERFLSSQELARLGKAIQSAELAGKNPNGLSVIRLLLTTGARKSEIEGLRWDEVDFERSTLRIGDSKTGAKVIPIGAPALEVLSELATRVDAGETIMRNRSEVPSNLVVEASPYVFPASRGSSSHWTGTPKIWTYVREKADLQDVRLHDLRHTFASLAIGAAGGSQSLTMIGKLLGHADVRTTARYAHLADDPVRQAAERISQAAEAGLNGRTAEVFDIAGGKRNRSK